MTVLAKGKLWSKYNNEKKRLKKLVGSRRDKEDTNILGIYYTSISFK